MDEWMAQKGGGNDTDMTKEHWELIYIALDIVGIVVFTTLFRVLRPRPWRWDRYEAAFAVMKIALVGFFIWLLISDVTGHLKIQPWRWLGEFPIRGLGLRLFLLVPGAGLLFRLTK